MQKCAFFDRDGVVNEDYEYVHKVENFVFCEGLFELLKELKKYNYLLVLVTNQSGIGRGFYTESDMHSLHDFMQQKLHRVLGFGFDKIYFCPHTPEEHCSCRKPNTGMIESACKDFKIQLAQSLFIGDRLTDMECAANAGISHRFLITSKFLPHLDKSIQKVKTLHEVRSIIQTLDSMHVSIPHNKEL